MPKRYVTRAEVTPWTWGHPEEWSDGKQTPPIMVFEREGDPQKTGLLDARGNDLFRVEDRNPIGFHAKIE